MKKKVVVGVTALLAVALAIFGINGLSEKKTDKKKVKTEDSVQTKEDADGGDEKPSNKLSADELDKMDEDIFKEYTFDDMKDELEGKEIAEERETFAPETDGVSAVVTEYVYADESGMSMYKLEYVSNNYREIKLVFEGPANLSEQIFIDAYGISLVSYSPDRTFAISFMDYLAFNGYKNDEYEKAKNKLYSTKEAVLELRNQFAGLAEDEIKDEFGLESATLVKVENEKVQLIDETVGTTNPKFKGYSAITMYFTDPLITLCTYTEDVATYDDEATLTIFDSIKWNK